MTRNSVPELATVWSVVIPCHRSNLRWLGEAVFSALRLGCPPSNVVLVADGPVERAPGHIARQYPGVRVVRHTQTRGVAAARSSGLDAVHTALVTFLDHDDYFEPGMLNALVQIDLAGGTGAVVGNMAVIERSTGVRRVNRLWPRKTGQWRTASLDLMLEMAQIGRWVIASDVARVCSFAPNVWQAQDLAFLAQVVAATDVISVPDTVLAYRQHSGQDSLRHGRLLNAEEERVLQGIMRLAGRRKHGGRAVRRRLAARGHYQAGRELRSRGEPGRALAELFVTLLRDPTVLRSSIGRRAVIIAAGSTIKTSVVRGRRRREESR